MTPWLAESEFLPDDTEADVGRRMGAMIDDLGLEHFSFIVLTPPSQRPFGIVNTLRTSYPDEWTGRYMAKRYFELDPVTDLARDSARPFFWGQGRFLRSFKKPQRLVFDEARVFKITYGLGVPVRGPDGSLSVFNVVSSDKRHLHDVTRGAYGRSLRRLLTCTTWPSRLTPVVLVAMASSCRSASANASPGHWKARPPARSPPFSVCRCRR